MMITARKNSDSPLAVNMTASHSMTAIKKLKRQAARQAAAMLASGNDPLMRIRDSLRGKTLFGEDALAYQRRMRDEWPQ